MLLFFGSLYATSCTVFYAIFLKILANCFNNSICSDLVLLELAVTESICPLADSTTVSSGVTIGEVRYLCLKNSASKII